MHGSIKQNTLHDTQARRTQQERVLGCNEKRNVQNTKNIKMKSESAA
jgi:hypothetical protein